MSCSSEVSPLAYKIIVQYYSYCARSSSIAIVRGNFSTTCIGTYNTNNLLVVSRYDVSPSWLLRVRGYLLDARNRTYPSLVDFDWVTNVLRISCHHEAHISVVPQVLTDGGTWDSSACYWIRGYRMLNGPIWNNTLSERHIQATMLLLSNISSCTLGTAEMRLVFDPRRI